jgi:hypothetical protein
MPPILHEIALWSGPDAAVSGPRRAGDRLRRTPPRLSRLEVRSLVADR